MAGALLVGSLYILFGYRLAHGISILPAAKQILEIEPFMPQVLLAAFCFLVGSLYITGLEGIVDWLHRKMALRDFTALKAGPKGWVLRSIAPLSDSARRRIKVEAARFYRQYAETCEDAPTFPEEQSRFVDSVIAETLWMEGKLIRTWWERILDRCGDAGKRSSSTQAGRLWVILFSASPQFFGSPHF
jgi:hypothetical protein